MDKRTVTIPESAGGRLPPAEVTISHLNNLPTLAPIAIALLQLTADERSSAAEVARGMQADPALTAKLLSIANSASTGVRQEVTTVDRAVSLLGFRTVRNLVLALKIFEVFHQPSRRTSCFDRMEFWRHTLGVACAARRLAELRPELKVDREEAFSAGLLHDLGKIALDAVFPKAYERIVERVDQDMGDIADVERALLGADHTEAGRGLAEKWNLPQKLREVIWLHHFVADALPPNVTARDLILLVQLADMLTREQGVGYSGNYLTNESSEDMGRRLGFKLEQLEAVAAMIESDVRRQADMLGLDLPITAESTAEALNRANEELGKVNAELLNETRQNESGSRYFRALVKFDQRLSTSSQLADVVSATVEAGLTALQRPAVGAFSVACHGDIIEMAWRASDKAETQRHSVRVAESVSARLKAAPNATGGAVLLPAELREPLARVAGAMGAGNIWWLPILLDQTLQGGLLFADEAANPPEESAGEELRSLLVSLGLAMARAAAQAEVRRLADDLAESNRRLQTAQGEVLRTRTLAIIAEMAAGAAHELNTPLAVISGRAQMLRQQVQDTEQRRWLDAIHEKALECSNIVTELMSFARPTPPELETLDLAELVAQLRNEWTTLTGLPATRFSVNAGSGGVQVVGDRGQLRGVLAELLRNAADAVSDNNGTIQIGWRVVPAASLSFLAQDPDVSPVEAEWVEVQIRDTGRGMGPAVRQRAFDPFFSHRPAGRGRGLGLSRVHRAIEAHGGRIDIESRPGEGTTVRVFLPHHSGQPAK